MRILIIGGTGLTGTAITDAAVAAGHDVTCVHRGRSAGRGVPVPDGVEQIRLDRIAAGHAQLADRTWDSVIDVSGYAPAVVRDALEHLADAAHWTYVSTVSVYADSATPMQSEDAPTADIDDADVRAAALSDPRFDWRAQGLYGEMKSLCEREVTAARGGDALIVRPCVIAGAHDHTWRVPYWIDRARTDATEPMLAPGHRDAPVAVVDVRDLATFAIDGAAARLGGIFNTCPDPTVATVGALVDGACTAAGRDPSTVRWVDEETLEQAGVEPWAELPFWLPESTGSAGMTAFDASRGRAAGLATRPLAETAVEVAAWLDATPADVLPDRATTMTRAREAELLRSLADV